MTKQTKEVQIIDLDKFSTSQLPELQNKKQELKDAIQEFPFVEITDNASYELAKKSRTGVKTIRTSLEKEKKMVIGKLKEKVLNVVSDEYDLLLAEEVVPVEKEYQSEVTRWEDIKEQERLEKIRIEEERIFKIKNEINIFEIVWDEAINQLNFDSIQKIEDSLVEKIESYDYASLQEFEIEFKAKLAFLRTKLEDKIKVLTEKENIRLEQEKLAEECKENERKETIKNSISDYQTNWEDRISNISSLKEFESEKELFDSFKGDGNYLEFIEEFLKRKALVLKSFERKKEMLDLEAEQAKKSEEQRIARENFAKEKAQFEEEKRIAKIDARIQTLKSIGFANENYTRENAEVNLPDDEWETFLADLKIQIEEEKNKSDKDIIEEAFSERPLTPEDAFEPETNPNEIEVIEDNFEIEQPNVIDEEQTPYNVLTMTFEEKQKALTDWISNREEYELDALIEQYLN